MKKHDLVKERNEKVKKACDWITMHCRNIKREIKWKIEALNKKEEKNEKFFFWISLGLFVVGVIAEVFSSYYYLIEIESDSFNGICTAIVGIQATVSVVIFSFITIFSNFQEKEKYGIPIVKYLIKYRNVILNQSDTFYVVMILLIISVISLFFGWINLIFCSFIISTLLVIYLAKESFLIYRMEDIDEEIFSFLKTNIHNKNLDILDEYLRCERNHMDNGDYKGKKPESKLDKLWGDEIEKYSPSLDSEEFKESHTAFTSLVTEYLNSSDMSVQSYGIEIALLILERYSKEKKRDSKVNIYGIIDDDIPVVYAKDSFRKWMLSLTHIVYSDNPNRIKVRNIVSLVNKLETTVNKYDRYSLTNNFLFLLIQGADGKNGNLDDLSQILRSFKSALRIYKKPMNQDNKYTEYAIHSYLMAIECGYIQIVGQEFKKYGSDWKPETKEEKLLFGIIVCYLYYMGYVAEEYEIEKLYDGRIKKGDFIKVLQDNNDVIFNFFLYLDLSTEYLDEMKKYMKSYEILILNTGSKTMIIDDIIDKGMILFKALATNPFMDKWLEVLVNNDWFHIYNMFVLNKNIKNELLEIKWFGNNTEESIDTIYTNLVDTIVKLSYSAVLNSSKIITNENEDRFADYLKHNLEKLEVGLSFGSVSQNNKINIKPILLRRLEFEDSFYWKDLSSKIKGKVLYFVCKLFSDVFKSKVITCHFDAEDYLNTIDSYDYLTGNTNIPLYDKDFVLRRRVYETVSKDYYAPFNIEDSPAIIAADKDKIGVKIGIIDVKVRKLTDEEKRGNGNKVFDRYKEQIVNDIYFSFDEEDYFKFMDNEYRVLDISFSVGVNANEDDGICYIFKRQERK